MTDSSDWQGFEPQAGFSAERVQSAGDGYSHTDEPYTRFQYDPLDPLIAPYRGLDYEGFARVRTDHPLIQHVIGTWRERLAQPFAGVTSDGRLIEGLYQEPEPAEADAAPTAAMTAAAEALDALLSDAERERLHYDLDAEEWRCWSNPEFLVYRVGLRLEEQTPEQIEGILAVIRASLSPVGYERLVTTMRLNAYLGSLLELPQALGEYSYQFSIYGRPSLDEPWGWQLFGHHIAVNVLVAGRREVIAPVFLGAEPNEMPGNDAVAFKERQRTALELAHSFTPAQRAKAVVYESMRDPRMPEGRLHPLDERHLAGAFQDNAVIPYEGVRLDELDEHQRRLVMTIAADQLALLPEGPLRVKLREIREHLDDTWFCWIGEIGDDGRTPFYFRIQSPVYLAEFDHHAGVWLSNATPEVFHTHTTLRYPNGNDYGRAIVARWRAGS